MQFRKLAMTAIPLALLTGCAYHNVKYEPYIKNTIAPTDHATVLHGTIDESRRLAEQAGLPHNTPRQRWELLSESREALLSQLGSGDYVLIGEVYGGGNAIATFETLDAALCKKAATRGGDVVLVFRQTLRERPYVYSSPGYATTHVYGTGYGSASAYTTYTPGTTYASVNRFPEANGLVFKYVPGTADRFEAISDLPDDSLDDLVKQVDALGKKKSLTLDQAIARCDELVANARDRHD